MNIATLRYNDTARQILQDTAFFIKAVVVALAVLGVASLIYIRQLERIPEFQEAAQKYEQRCGTPIQYDAYGNKVPLAVSKDGC